MNYSLQLQNPLPRVQNQHSTIFLEILFEVFDFIYHVKTQQIKPSQHNNLYIHKQWRGLDSMCLNVPVSLWSLSYSE